MIEHFLRRSRYIFIMNSCMCRDANHCSHYPHELGCIFLGAGVPRIPSKMGRRATADEAIEHMRKAREKGLVHLIGRNKIDSVWLNTGPKEDLLSICNCCECCCLWKMMPQLSNSIGSGVMRMPGVVVSVTEACTGCGRCVKDDVCFVGALSIAGRQGDHLSGPLQGVRTLRGALPQSGDRTEAGGAGLFRGDRQDRRPTGGRNKGMRDGALREANWGAKDLFVETYFGLERMSAGLLFITVTSMGIFSRKRPAEPREGEGRGCIHPMPGLQQGPSLHHRQMPILFGVPGSEMPQLRSEHQPHVQELPLLQRAVEGR